MLDAEKNSGVFKPYLGNIAVQWGNIDINNLQMMAMSRNDIERFRLRFGDLLVCEGGEVGRSAIWEAPIAECYYQKALHRLRPLRNYTPQLMLAFLRYWVDHRMLTNYVSQTSIAHLTKEKLFEVPLAVPPLPEQIAITTVLSDTDALIASLDQLIAKKRAIKQATMQQLLTGRMRLPGFEGKWEMRKLGDISSIKTGKKNNEEKIEDGAYPFFVRSQTVERINTFTFDGEAILIPGEGGIGNIIHYINGKFDYHQRVYKISNFVEDVYGKFIYYCMKQNFYNHATRNSVKATVDSLRLPTFQEFALIVPSVPEQTAIATVLADMDTEITVLEQRREKTRALKQGLMQELLTGKTRLV
jgi:type I restriction enzyme S subunit